MPNRAPTPAKPQHDGRHDRPSRTVVNGLWLQKSDCMTFLSTRRTTAPRSSDHGARALINKAITTAVAECNSWRAGHIHDENSTMRAAACSSCLLHVPSVLPPSCHSRGFNVRARVHHGAIAARLSGHACSLMTVMASELGWTSSTHDQRPMVASSYHRGVSALRGKHGKAVEGRGAHV